MRKIAINCWGAFAFLCSCVRLSVRTSVRLVGMLPLWQKHLALHSLWFRVMTVHNFLKYDPIVANNL